MTAVDKDENDRGGLGGLAEGLDGQVGGGMANFWWVPWLRESLVAVAIIVVPVGKVKNFVVLVSVRRYCSWYESSLPW